MVKPTSNKFKTYGNTRKIATGKGDDYTTGCLLYYPYFKENCKKISIDLSKEQALNFDPREIEQINFIANLDSVGNITMLFIIEEAKEIQQINFIANLDRVGNITMFFIIEEAKEIQQINFIANLDKYEIPQ